VSLAAVAVRVASAFYVAHPGFTDAYYYSVVADRLAHGAGLSADFVWNFLEAPDFAPLPVPSHRFWVPLATTLQAGGIALLGGLLGEFRAAQAAVIAVAAFLPAVTYAGARSLDVSARHALAAAAVVGLGGVFAPGWVATDSFAPAAVIGTLFFLAFARAARGSVGAGALAGLLVGLLYLARSEGALFGVALLALAAGRQTRRAGAVGSVVALVIGAAWFARDVGLGTGDLLARATLLVRYEDFFSFGSGVGLSAFLSAWPAVLAAKGGALVTNLITAVFALMLVLAPLAAAAAWWMRDRPHVRAWSLLLVLVFLVESLVFTLHSTRGSYFHSLAAFFPFGIALAAAGAERLVSTRGSGVASAWTAAALVVSAALSVGAVVQWDASFTPVAQARAAAARTIPSGPILAIDGAAWRAISGWSAIVTPAEGYAVAECVASRYEAKWLVLERAHFSAYDPWYRGEARPAWLGPPVTVGDIAIFPIDGPTCESPPIR
jgi:hypothetical protein